MPPITEKRRAELTRRMRVDPGSGVDLSELATDWLATPEGRKLSKDLVKDQAEAVLERNREELAEAQELLWANDVYGLLVVIQGIDAAGKDGTIKHVTAGLNPQGVEVTSFKQPSAEELDHHFLWRYAKAAPTRGRIGIFNRSHYEEVLVVRVHPEILEGQRLPPGPRGKRFWRERFDDINAFERHLDRNGIRVVKFFLHLSYAEQRRRFLERIDDPAKNWKFSGADVAERGHWADYRTAFEEAIAATSTTWAPWYVVPADRKWLMRALVSQVILDAVSGLDLAHPEPTPEQRAGLDAARQALLAEEGATTG